MIIAVGAIDNLVKGAAGQAVQNMNLMFGFKEQTKDLSTGTYVSRKIREDYISYERNRRRRYSSRRGFRQQLVAAGNQISGTYRYGNDLASQTTMSWQLAHSLRNVVKAAPVKWDQEIVYRHPHAQAVVCNSGIANACTGEEGYGYCKETAQAVSQVLGIPEDSVLVASTGVIGMQIPIDRITAGVKALAPWTGWQHCSRYRGCKSDHDYRYCEKGSGSTGSDRRPDCDSRRYV